MQRMRARLVMSIFVSLVLLGSGLMTGIGGARAQDATTSGVRGNSYTSPVFPFSVSWDANWSVADEVVEADYTLIQLSDGISQIWFEANASTLDVAGCLQYWYDQLATNEKVSNLVVAEDEGGPMTATEEGRAWAVYGFTYTGDTSTFEYYELIDCRPIVAGESILTITHLATSDVWASEVPALLDVLGRLAIGEGAVAETDNGDTGVIEGGVNGDLAQFITFSTQDVEAYWATVFPTLASGTAYSPLAAFISFDTSVETACGSATAGEAGPFYCPASQTMYYDMLFGNAQLENFGGNRSVIAVAIAHELGHHVQELMDWPSCTETPCIDPAQMTTLEAENQADCFAGAWTADAEGRGRLGSFDVETSASQFTLLIGDDGRSGAEGHGRGALRTYWYLAGYFNGPSFCLTASAVSDPNR